MDPYLSMNRDLWDEWTAIHERSAFYDLASFREGGVRLADYELEDMGDGFNGAKFVCSPPLRPADHQDDLWIGLVGNLTHEMRHLEMPSVERRLHGSNQTPLGWRSLPTILRARVMLARCLVEARRRSRR